MKHFNLLLAAFFALVVPAALSAQDCSTATPIGGFPYNDNLSLNENGAGADSAWYSFSVTENGYITISSCDASTNPDTRLYLYDGTCANLNLIATSDNDCGFAALVNDRRVIDGRTYYLLWDNKTQAQLAFDFDVSFVSDANYVQPGNDDICDATEVMVDDTVTMQSNEHATVEDVAEFGIGNIAGIQAEWDPDFNVHNTVWYTFVAPESGAAGVEMIGANFDAQLAVFTGSCTDFGSLNFVAASENGTNMDPSVNMFCLTPGETYYVLVDGFGTESGDFDISVKSIDLREPYVIVFDPDTNANPAFACPGEENFELTAELRIAADSTNIWDIPVNNAYDSWYQAALLEYVNTIEWELATEDGTGDFAFDEDLGAGTYTATFDDGCRPSWSDSFIFEDESREELTVTQTSIAQPGCVGESGEFTFNVSGGFRFQSALTYQDDSVVVYYKKVALADGVGELDNVTYQGPVVGNSVFFSTQLTEGHYRVLVEDGCGNTDTLDFTMTNPTISPLQVGVDSLRNPFCPQETFGMGTGFVGLFTSGGQNKPLEFDWAYTDTATTMMPDTLFDPVNHAVPAPTMMAFDEQDYDVAVQGWYRIIVFDGCNQRDTVYGQLRDTAVDKIAVVGTATNPTSFSAQDGEIELAVTGGNGIYFADWVVDGMPTPELEDNLNPTGLAQGIYEVTVRDTCAAAMDTTMMFKLLAPVANDEPCDAIAITEDDTLVTYSNEGATVQSGESAALGIPQDQDEGFNGWEETGVQSSVWFTFTAPESGAVSVEALAYEFIGNISFDPQVAIFSASDCNDINTFEYLAANDDFGGGALNNSSFVEAYCLTPGETYYILVDGFAGIGQEGCFGLYINEIDVDPIAATFTKTNVSCASQGSVTLSDITGGVYVTSPEQFLYTVDFNGNVTTGVTPGSLPIQYNNLAAGTYTLTVTDTCGNIWSEDIEVEPYNPGALQIDIETTSPVCVDGIDGVIEINYTDGAGGYSTTFEQLTGGSTIGGPITGANPVFTENNSGDIDAGVYRFTVTDVCANVKVYEVTVTDPTPDPVVVNITKDDPECPGESNGSMEIVYEGGSGLYYLTVRENDENGPVYNGLFENFQTSDTVISGLEADDYYVMIQEFCSYDDTSFADVINIVDPVFDPLDIEVTEVNPSNPGAADGSFSFTIEGGAIPYTIFAFALDGNGDITDTLDIVSNEVTGLAAGDYRLAVDDNCDNDANNFSGTVDITLFDPPAADDVCDAGMVAVGSTVSGSNVAATVQAGEVSGLNIPNNVDCESFEGWCAQDGIDASVWYKTTVTSTGAFSALVEAGGAFDAQIALFTIGDTCADFSAFELLAANDDINANSNSDAYVEVGCLEPGTEVYILIDANVTSDAVNVAGGFDLTLTEINYSDLDVLGNVINPTNEISNDGSINVQVVGGLAPFTFEWVDNGTASTVDTEDRMNLGVGTYTVTVTDACGNTASNTFDLNQQGVSYDDVCDAVFLPVDGETREYTNEGATLQQGELSIEPSTNADCFSDTAWCSNDGLDATIWFRFFAPASGTVTVDLCNGGNNTFDTQIAVYRSNTCTNFAAFTPVGANDDFAGCALGSVLELTGLEPCGQYYILVDTDDDQRGTMGIRLEDPSNSVNAGDDVTTTVCEEDGTIDLNTLLASNADANGTFVDVNNTGTLNGSDFNAALAGEGTFTFEYRVAADCNGDVVTTDVAIITITVDDCVGIVEVEGNTFQVFPNPTNGKFSISAANAVAGVNVTVTDYAGKEVTTITDAFANSAKLGLDIEGVAAGVYAVRLSGAANGVIKVIVK